MLTALTLLLFLVSAGAELHSELELVEPDPGWPTVLITGTLDRPASLEGATLQVAASTDKVSPFHDRYLAISDLTPDDHFELSLAAPPQGVHLWMLVEGRSSTWETTFHQLYNHYPIEVPSEGLHDVHFTMADYRLTFEGVDPWEALAGPWWYFYGLVALGLITMMLFRRKRAASRGQRLPPLPTQGALPREGWWMASLLLLAALLRVPSMAESLSMTEFVHTQIAARGANIGDASPQEHIAALPTCKDICQRLAEGGIQGCEAACIKHFGHDQLPKSTASCAFDARGHTTPHQLLACLAKGETP